MLTGNGAVAWFDRYRARITSSADVLTELDRQVGDGDFGWNLSSALDHAALTVADLESPAPSEVFGAISDAFLNTGGTSGPLLGLWFGQLARQTGDPLGLPSLAAGVAAGTAAVRRLGKAEPGHKTMVDALVPATEALASAATRSRDTEAALTAAATEAARGSEATRALAGRRGRASYIADRAKGVVDPGALAIAWLFHSALDEDTKGLS